MNTDRPNASESQAELVSSPNLPAPSETDPFFRAVIHGFAGDEPALYNALMAAVGRNAADLPGTIDAFARIVHLQTTVENVLTALMQHADEIRPLGSPTLAERIAALSATSQRLTTNDPTN